MASEQLDAVLEELATLGEHHWERRELLERANHLMLDHPELGAQLVARIVASPEDTAELEEMSVLLGSALDTARMARENRQGRGDRFLSAVEESLAMQARQGRLDMPHRLLLAGIWSRTGLQAPAALELTEADWQAAKPDYGDRSPGEMIDTLFADLEEDVGKDPAVLHAALTEMLPAMPAEVRHHVVQLAVIRPGSTYAQLGLLWLLDPDPALRLAAVEGLAARLQAGHLAADTTGALVMLRSWLPRDETYARLDQILSQALRAGVAPAQGSAAWNVREILASLPDGAGAQSIAIALHSGRRRKIAMVLLKQRQGVKDAFLLPSNSAAAQKAMVQRIIDETGALAVTAAWLEQTLAMAIAEGLEAGRPPAPGLIEIAPLCGFEALRPQAVSTSELVASLAGTSGVAEMAARARTQLIRMSKDWWRRHGVADSWFEQNDSVHERLEQADGAAARETAVWEALEADRDWWTASVARSAHLLEAADHADTPAFVATAMALAEGQDLKKIGFMKLVHEQTIEAWRGDAPDAEIEGDDFEVEVEPPEPERHGELGRLVKGSDISSDWVDGFLMAVGIAPAPIHPNEWASEIVNEVLWTLDRSKLQRFLDLLMSRAHTALDQALDRDLLAAALAQRGKRAKQDWAAGFSQGCERFHSAWSAKSVAADDRRMLKLIAGGEKAPFSAEDTRSIGLWIEARRARNLSKR